MWPHRTGKTCFYGSVELNKYVEMSNFRTIIGVSNRSMYFHERHEAKTRASPALRDGII